MERHLELLTSEFPQQIRVHRLLYYEVQCGQAPTSSTELSVTYFGAAIVPMNKE